MNAPRRTRHSTCPLPGCTRRRRSAGHTVWRRLVPTRPHRSTCKCKCSKNAPPFAAQERRPTTLTHVPVTHARELVAVAVRTVLGALVLTRRAPVPRVTSARAVALNAAVRAPRVARVLAGVAPPACEKKPHTHTLHSLSTQRKHGKLGAKQTPAADSWHTARMDKWTNPESSRLRRCRCSRRSPPSSARRTRWCTLADPTSPARTHRCTRRSYHMRRPSSETQGRNPPLDPAPPGQPPG